MSFQLTVAHNIGQYRREKRANPQGVAKMNGDSGTILVIEDEVRYRRLITTNLRMAGYHVREAGNGRDAIQSVYQKDPDAILLDLRLPDLDGFTLCQRLRKMTATPIVVLTALDTEEALVQALDLGADDYVSKPFSPSELLARLRAVMRRSQAAWAADEVGCGQISFQPETREVTVRGRTTRLTPTEWRLLRELARQCGKIVSHEYLLGKVWGPAYQEEHEYLRVYVRRLRQYIEPDPRRPEYLISYAGVGYALYPHSHGGNRGE